MSSASYDAAVSHAAVIEQSWAGILRLTGPDRVSWLQGMVSNDVQKLRPGDGCYAAHLSAQGKLLAHMVVLCREDALWLLMERETTGKIAAAFDRLIIMEDAQVQDISDEYAVIGFVGPHSAALLRTVAGQDAVPEALFGHRTHDGLLIVRDELGYLVISPRADSQSPVSAARDAGAVLIGFDTWNILRVEAGLPLYGVDIDESTTLPELGEKGISYDKGCYVGQEVVAKIKYIGHVNRKFVGFVFDPDVEGVEPRSAVRTGDKDSKEVGYLTTVVTSPSLGRPIGLGFVARVAASPGTMVEVAGKQGSIRARVASPGAFK